MIVTPIAAPLPGEHVVATLPRMRPFTDDARPGSSPGWRLRLRFWAGRALTRDALDLEQAHRAARLAWHGRLGTAGVVRGLEVALAVPPAPADPPEAAGHVLHVPPGYGLTARGDDVAVHRPLRVPLEAVPVGAAAPGDPPGPLPWAAVLVLRPAETGRFPLHDPDDPCELDPSRDAFSEQRRQDAALLRLVPLPDVWRAELGDPDDPRWRNRLVYRLFDEEAAGRPAAPPDVLPLALLAAAPAPDGGRRLFLDRSAVVRPGGLARPRPRPDAGGLPPGTPALWRARVDQFAEQLGATLPDADPATLAAAFARVPPAGLLPPSALDLLTTEAAAAVNAPDRAAVSRFFPPTFAVEVAPIPTEELDAALAASAPLAPLDLAGEAPDHVRLLVPLPLAAFDPHLLVIEREDPVFAAEVGRLVAERQDALQRRARVRARRAALAALVAGGEPLPPPDDPARLEPEPTETVETLGLDAALVAPAALRGPYAVRVDFGEARRAGADTVLYVRLRTDAEAPPEAVQATWHRAGGGAPFVHRWPAPPPHPPEAEGPGGAPRPTPLWRPFTVRAGDLGLSDAALTGLTLQGEGGRLALGDAGAMASDDAGAPVPAPWWQAAADVDARTTFDGPPWAPVEGAALLAPFEAAYDPAFEDGRTLDERLDALTPLAGAGPDGQAVAVRDDGLDAYVDALERLVARADDRVDLGFLKAQSNLHRIRQVLLGDEVANELLTSPALSSIVKQQSARATEDELVGAFRAFRAAQAAAEPEPDDGGGAPAGGSIAFRFGGASLFDPGRLFGDAPGGTPGGGAGGRPLFDPGRVPILQPAPGGFAVEGAVDLRSLAVRPALTFGAAAASRDDVIGAEPSVGQGFDVRTLTIAKRFEAGPVRSAFDYADVGMREAVAGVAALDLGFDDEPVPDVSVERDGGPAPVTFRDLATGAVALDALVFAEGVSPQEDDDLPPDTGRLLARGIRRVDATVLVFRRLEFYIARRRALLRAATEVRAAVQARVGEAGDRLGVLAGRLAEARHDVAVARALRAEELDRVAAVNARRDALVRDEVHFLAYVRPRTVEPARRVVPGWRLAPADAPAPVPACLQVHDEPPDALRAYVQLFRHAPARWFTRVAPRLAELNTHEKLSELLGATRTAAAGFLAEAHVPFVRADLAAVPAAALQAGFALVAAERRRAAAGLGAEPARWSDGLRRAEDHAALGDVLDGRHGHPALARAAAAELETIEQVATCLHAEAAVLPPSLRLAWVERYSQFDRPAPLDDVTALPRAETLPRAVRERLQAFMDWLFDRVDARETDAVRLVNDLVRIALLLASHAPVKAIVAGHVPRPMPVRPGVRIPLRPVDRRLVRVGMAFQVWRGTTVVAHGAVEDLDGDEVTARVDGVEAATTSVEPGLRVQFIPAALAPR